MINYEKLTIILFIILLWFVAMGLIFAIIAMKEIALWNAAGPELTTAGQSIGWGM